MKRFALSLPVVWLATGIDSIFIAAWMQPPPTSFSTRLPISLEKDVGSCRDHYLTKRTSAEELWLSPDSSVRAKKRRKTMTQCRFSQALAAAFFCLTATIAGPSWANDESSSLPNWTYGSIMESGPRELRSRANVGLLDDAVETVNTMYYDNSGGARFVPTEFSGRWQKLRESTKYSEQSRNAPPNIAFDTRDGAVQGLKWLVGTLNDPFSKYLTQEELRAELRQGSDGFLGIGAIVEPPYNPTSYQSTPISTSPVLQNSAAANLSRNLPRKKVLSATRAANLPVVTAVVPDSPAERAGIVVGDRIVAVGSDKFLGRTCTAVTRALRTKYSAENYAGYPDLTIANPLFMNQKNREIVAGYRLSHVQLPTASVEPFRPYSPSSSVISGGDSIVHYELLTPSNSILDKSASLSPVGYIRLTRFSRASTAGFVKAISELEAAGASSIIVDLRNNYGGIIQEAMLTASTLLRDPHTVMCYTQNNKGGFSPHDVQEYIMNPRYPGYLLSSEPSTIAMKEVQREGPNISNDYGIMQVHSSSYASLSKQTIKHGLYRTTVAEPSSKIQLMSVGRTATEQQRQVQLHAQKKVVILVNEGTASSAEMFASALRDNGRASIVGTKTYGKGLIQHNFPMSDGGAIRLTVAEYLTPLLRHVTSVGSARFDSYTGAWVGGGIRPDVYCDSSGIPTNVGADMCVGVALDTIEETQDAGVSSVSELVLKAKL